MQEIKCYIVVILKHWSKQFTIALFLALIYLGGTGIGKNILQWLICWDRCRHDCPDAIPITHFKALFQFDPVLPLSVIFLEVLHGFPCPLDNSCAKELIMTGTVGWHFYNLFSLANVQEHRSIRHSFRTSLTAAATWRMRMRIVALI